MRYRVTQHVALPGPSAKAGDLTGLHQVQLHAGDLLPDDHTVSERAIEELLRLGVLERAVEPPEEAA